MMGAVGVGLSAVPEAGSAGRRPIPQAPTRTDPHTSATLAALIDAIIPATPDLAKRIGPEHEPGGLATGLDKFLDTYLNHLLALGAPGVGDLSDARLAEAVAAALDEAAVELVASGRATESPDPDPPGGPFAALTPRDRLRAITVFESKECDTSGLPGPFVESDAGLVAQLGVGFTELLYYSEWDGYEEFSRPPGERRFTGEVRPWSQVGYPGPANGYAGLRGYLRLDGQVDGVELTATQGEFEENEYENATFSDPYPETNMSNVSCLPPRNPPGRPRQERSPEIEGELDGF